MEGLCAELCRALGQSVVGHCSWGCVELHQRKASLPFKKQKPCTYLHIGEETLSVRGRGFGVEGSGFQSCKRSICLGRVGLQLAGLFKQEVQSQSTWECILLICSHSCRQNSFARAVLFSSLVVLGCVFVLQNLHQFGTSHTVGTQCQENCTVFCHPLSKIEFSDN